MTAVEPLTENNRAIVERFYAFAASGDFDGLASVLAEDVVIHEPDYLPYGGTYHGVAEFAALVPKIANILDLTSVVVHYTIADGNRVAACVGIRDLNTGNMTHLIEQSTLRDGKIVDVVLFYHDAQSLMAQPKIV